LMMTIPCTTRLPLLTGGNCCKQYDIIDRTARIHSLPE
jgi:hypothetical protein